MTQSLDMNTCKLGAFIASIALSSGAVTANAAIVGSTDDVDFTKTSTSFAYSNQFFTLSDNGTGFPNAVSASTSGSAMLATDFFGISVFFDPPRNGQLFDGSLRYESYPKATVLSFSSFPTFIGLAVTADDGVHYGYAEFAGTLLEGYAFETTPNVGIAPGAALVPEPESIALLGIGLATLAIARRRRKA